MNKLMITVAVLTICLGFAAESQARPRVSVSFGINIPPVVAVTDGCVVAVPAPTPVAYTPAPVVVPAPVAVAPAPVVVYQPAVVCAPATPVVVYRPVYVEPRHDWHDRYFRYEPCR
jgi:hypothetical protein